ncbi:discoidin domain-containing protein [Paenibacillus favisporus]|uniref:discoidin domain-containing protein n=1 Tax=Paenibacillus favisporus TaxID=221028 RepID=UPI003D2C6EEF
MAKLPSGLQTYEPSDTVRRIAQNENIEATDALFHGTGGHRHTGKAGDAPLIGTEGIAGGAVTGDKIASTAVTGDKVARYTLCRRHLKSGRISRNAAKYKPVTVTAGQLSGLPTVPYFQSGEHFWALYSAYNKFPQSMTVMLGDEHSDIEGVSFEKGWNADPVSFYIETSSDNTNWRKVYTYSRSVTDEFPRYHPFDQAAAGSYIRLTVTAPDSSGNTIIAGFGVFSRACPESSPDFKVENGVLKFHDGSGWKGVGIKSVQRGTTNISFFYPNGNGSLVKEVTITAVNPQKSFVNITTTGLSHWSQTSPMMDGSVCATLVGNNKVKFNFMDGFYEAYAEISWEVIEFA